MKTFAPKSRPEALPIKPAHQYLQPESSMAARAAASSPSILIDNRPQTKNQQALQAMADNNPQGQRMIELQALADQSGPVQRLMQMQAAADNSAHQTAQRQLRERAFSHALQRKESLDENEPQMTALQRRETEKPSVNRSRIPAPLKAGLEQLSGMDLSGVRVHYNSPKPAQLHAFAYAQGQDIHLGPGQERHLPHEGWHVVQQMQGRVKPTFQARNVSINDDAGLESEADFMGRRALHSQIPTEAPEALSSVDAMGSSETIQRLAFIYKGGGSIYGSRSRNAEQQRDLLEEAFQRFYNRILSRSPLATGVGNQVVIHPINERTHRSFNDYAQTVLYIGNNGYKGKDPYFQEDDFEDYDRFTEMWEWSRKNGVTRNTAIRIVITINMTANDTIEQLYATLLHEWYVHAEKWESAIYWMRNVFGSYTASWLQYWQGGGKRGDDEHKDFANWSNRKLESKLDNLDLDDDLANEVYNHMIEDRDDHDKSTGKFKHKRR